MLDLIRETVHSVIVAGILTLLWIVGHRAGVRRQRGWSLILAGFSLFLLGTLIEVVAHIPGLSRYLLQGDAHAQGLLANMAGYLPGLALQAAGLLIWIATLTQLQRTEAGLQRSQAELQARDAQRTAELAAANDQLQSEIGERRQAEERVRAALEESRQRQKEISALLLAACGVLEHKSFAQNARALFNACKNLTGATAGYIALSSPDDTEAHVLLLDQGAGPAAAVDLPPLPMIGLRGDVCRSGRVAFDNSPTPSPGDPLPVENTLLAPLLIRGQGVGLLALANKPGGFDPNDASLTEAFADLAALGLYNTLLVGKLEISEQRLSAVVETANDAIVTADEQGRILSWNRAAEAIFGWSAGEMVGQLLAQIVPAALPGQHEAGLSHTAATGETDIIGKAFETVGTRHNGEEFPLELSLTTWKTEEGTFFTALMRDITERRRVQEALREANQALEAVILASPLAILALDSERNVRLWNPAAERIFGWGEQEVLNAPNPIIPDDGRDEFWALTERALHGEDLAGIEIQCQTKAGALIDMGVWTSALHDQRGQVSGTLGIMADITDRRRADEAMRRYADEQRALYSVASAVAATLDVDQLLDSVLDTVLGVLKADDSWVLMNGTDGSNDPRIVAWHGAAPPAACHTVIASMASCPIYASLDGDGQSTAEPAVVMDCPGAGLEQSESARPRHHACIPLSAGGQVSGLLHVGWHGTETRPAYDPALLLTIGRQVGMALHNAQLYRAARQVDRLQVLSELDQELAASLDWNRVAEVTLRQIATGLNAPLGILLASPTPTPTGLKVTMPLLHGWNDDLPARSAWWSLLAHRLEQDAGIAGLSGQELALGTGRPELESRWGPHGLVVPLWGDEDLLAILALGGRHGDRPFSGEDRALLQVAADHAGQALQNAQLYDELKQLLCERELTRAQLIQSEKIAALGRLVASITHEINNPLQAVQNYLTLLDEELDGTRRPDALKRYLSVVQSEVERVAGIMHRMRDYYRPSRGGLERTDLQTVVQDVLELVDKQLQSAGVEVIRSWPADLPPIEANEDHLKQVVLNLVLNAVDAMPGGGTLRIGGGLDVMPACGEQPAEPAVRMVFSDTGIGLSPDAQTKLFEPFFTTKDGGAGLGLYVTYGIVGAHHGQIQVDSQEGVGTTLTLLLPLVQPAWSS